MNTKTDIAAVPLDPNQILLGGAAGVMWHPFVPRSCDVRYEHFSALANIPRWGGGTRVPYSVAEHSIRCAEYCVSRGWSREVVFQTLVHDLHEIYPPGDVPGPLLRGDHPYSVVLRSMERGAREALRAAIGVPLDLDPRVREADLVLLSTERRDLMPAGFDEHFAGLPEPLPEAIVPMPRDVAAAMFDMMYLGYGGMRA